MAITEFRIDVKESLTADEVVSPSALVEERPRDAQGHCWDGHACDHEDHATYATIHFIR
jgi:hypothetical protein